MRRVAGFFFLEKGVENEGGRDTTVRMCVCVSSFFRVSGVQLDLILMEERGGRKAAKIQSVV